MTNTGRARIRKSLHMCRRRTYLKKIVTTSLDSGSTCLRQKSLLMLGLVVSQMSGRSERAWTNALAGSQGGLWHRAVTGDRLGSHSDHW